MIDMQGDLKFLELAKENSELKAQNSELREKNKKTGKRLSVVYTILFFAVLVLGLCYCESKDNLNITQEELSALESDMEEVREERNELERTCIYFDEYVSYLQDELDDYGYWEELADVEATVSSNGEKSFVVYITENDDMYHKNGCQSLEGSQLSLDIKKVHYYGAEPCPVCYQEQDKSEDYTESSAEDQSVTVYITNTGSKYHEDGCQYLRESKNAVTLSQAKSWGYTACSRCY